MDKPVYLGFPVLQLSKLLMYETDCDKFQRYFGKNIYNDIMWIQIALY